MLSQQQITLIVQILLIAGALNHGAVALNDTDVVKELTGGGDLEKYVKVAVAAAGAYTAYKMLQARM